MYTILLADAEDYIRKGISQKLKRLSGRISIIGEAGDGEEALALTDTLRPDIVITDSILPKINGLNYIEQVRGKNLPVHFIIESEFDNFSFVQQALRLGVHDYLLKPVNNDELCTAVLSICNLIDAERAASQKEKVPPNREDAHSRLFNYFAWSDLSKKEGADDELCRFAAQQQGFSFPNRFFTVFAVQLPDCPRPKEDAGRDAVLLPFSVASCFEKELNGYGTLQCFFEQGVCSYICCLFNHSLTDSQVEPLLARCAENAAAYLGLPCVVGALEAMERFSSLSELCLQAQALCAQSVTLENQRVIRTRDLNDLNDETCPCREIADTLIKLLRTEPVNEEKLLGLSESLLSGLVSSKLTHRAILDTCYGLVMSVLGALAHEAAALDASALPDEFMEALSSCRTAADFSKAVARAVMNIGNHIQRSNLSEGKKIVNKIKVQLEKEYYRDLKLSMFAADYFINQSYLSILFQQETGINYSQYLTKIRLEKAKELLEKTTFSTGKIAELVGYNDRNYFAAVFSKKFGITPMQYRACVTSDGQLDIRDQVV
ncbi:MAG TPA: response regulator [Feifaniaceae bacterium]|nr:response regulator [Feifaniaceae bacterium]